MFFLRFLRQIKRLIKKAKTVFKTFLDSYTLFRCKKEIVDSAPIFFISEILRFFSKIEFKFFTESSKGKQNICLFLFPQNSLE